MPDMAALCEHLTQAGIEWQPLERSDAHEVERVWRQIFASALNRRVRVREGSKADYAFSLEPCHHYLIVPFTSNVQGLPVSVMHRYAPMEALECRGRLIPLGAFNEIEFFV